jgi:small subunit ribosomal protein S2
MDKTQTTSAGETALKISIPTVKDLFKAGTQFGHETQRWNPKMQKYIYTVKNNIHIIDTTQTEEYLKKAAQFIFEAASRGSVVFAGTKRQAADIVQKAAVECGAHFVNQRWAGGLLTNFKMSQLSFNKLKSLEKSFEEGVEGRTKYEVSLMKKDWAKLHRLYSGIKTLDATPTAIFVVDARFEKGVIREARKMGIPVIAIVDTNTNPDIVDYMIPANDDAIASIKIIVDTLSAAVKAGNKGNGVRHQIKDYSKVEVKITKKAEVGEVTPLVQESIIDPTISGKSDRRDSKPEPKSPGKRGSSKGILERVQEQKEKVKEETKKTAEEKVNTPKETATTSVKKPKAATKKKETAKTKK